MNSLLLLTIATIGFQPAPTAPSPTPAPAPTITQQLVSQSAALKPLVKSPMATNFLDAVRILPQPQPRTIYRTKDRSKAINANDYSKLSPEQKAEYAPRECSPDFYYFTGYGSPLVYARVLDVLAPVLPKRPEAMLGALKLLDFGYGTIGHLKLLAACGADARGVDVEPMFAALYSEPGDIGLDTSHFRSQNESVGSVEIFTGRWPAEPALVTAIGGSYDIISSKNTLKAGYIHPTRPVDERFLVKLGVTDEEFLVATFKSLNSGGTFIIYNICPAQAPLDKPYLPHADGKSPFTQDQFIAAGFKILAFDVDDQAAILDYWLALGYNEGKSREETAKDIFAWYTIVRKP